MIGHAANTSNHDRQSIARHRVAKHEAGADYGNAGARVRSHAVADETGAGPRNDAGRVVPRHAARDQARRAEEDIDAPKAPVVSSKTVFDGGARFSYEDAPTRVPDDTEPFDSSVVSGFEVDADTEVRHSSVSDGDGLYWSRRNPRAGSVPSDDEAAEIECDEVRLYRQTATSGGQVPGEEIRSGLGDRLTARDQTRPLCFRGDRAQPENDACRQRPIFRSLHGCSSSTSNDSL